MVGWRFPLVFSEVLSLTLYDSLRRVKRHPDIHAFLLEYAKAV